MVFRARTIERYRTFGGLDAVLRRIARFLVIAYFNGDFRDIGLGQCSAILRIGVFGFLLRGGRVLSSDAIQRGSILRIARFLEFGRDRGRKGEEQQPCKHIFLDSNRSPNVPRKLLGDIYALMASSTSPIRRIVDSKRGWPRSES